MRQATNILKHLIIIAFLTLQALGCAVASGPSASSGSQKPKHRHGTIRVLYWNIQNGMWAGQLDHYQAFVDWVNSWNPDICIFDEGAQIYYDRTKDHMPNEERYLPAHWDELCSRWGHRYHVVTPRRPSTSTPFGLTNYPQVVTSHFPIDSVTIVRGHKPDTVIVNYSGWYQVHVKGVKAPLNIVTLHLKHGKYGYAVPKERRDESAEKYEGEQHRIKELICIMDHTVRKSKDPDKELWIMAGDYNSYSRRDNYAYKWNPESLAFQTQDYMISHSPFIDLFYTRYPDSFQPTCGDVRIDYMYVSEPMLNACIDIYQKPNGYTKREHSGVDKFYIPSDHYPIIADFKISKMK